MKDRKLVLLAPLAVLLAFLWLATPASADKVGDRLLNYPTNARTLRVGGSTASTRGTVLNRIITTTVSLAGDTTKSVTLTGAPANALLFATKAAMVTTNTTLTSATMYSAGVAHMTWSGPTTGTVNLLAIGIE